MKVADYVGGASLATVYRKAGIAIALLLIVEVEEKLPSLWDRRCRRQTAA
jgi:hypothetical protein